MRFGAVHSRGADVFFLILLWVEKNCFRNWFAHGDQTAAEDPSKKCGAQTSKSGSRTSRWKVYVKVSTKLDIHSFLTGSAAGPLAWSEIDPAHRAMHSTQEVQQNQTSKGLIVLGKDASVGWFVSGYVRLLQSQYESKSARTVLKIISQNLADYF